MARVHNEWHTEEGQAKLNRRAEQLRAKRVAPTCICRGDGWTSAGCRACQPVGSWAPAAKWEVR